jgi:hypothetical protein
MLRTALASLGAAVLLTACSVDRDVSQDSIRRGIANDIDEARRPASTDARPVMPSAAPPIENTAPVPSSPTTLR